MAVMTRFEGMSGTKTVLWRERSEISRWYGVNKRLIDGPSRQNDMINEKIMNCIVL
jgi:hypothetical protein